MMICVCYLYHVMLVFADLCVHICQYMLVFDDVCWYLLMRVGVCYSIFHITWFMFYGLHLHDSEYKYRNSKVLDTILKNILSANLNDKKKCTSRFRMKFLCIRKKCIVDICRYNSSILNRRNLLKLNCYLKTEIGQLTRTHL